MRWFGHLFVFQGLVLVVLIGLPISSIAQVLVNYDSALHENLSEGWLKRNESISVQVNANQFQDASWQIQLPEGSSLFFNEALWDHYLQDTLLVINNKSVLPYLDDEGNLEIIAFKPGISSEHFSLQKGYFNSSGERVETAKVLEKRKKDEIRDFFFIALIAVLFLIAIFRAFSLPFLGFSGTQKVYFLLKTFGTRGVFQKFILPSCYFTWF